LTRTLRVYRDIAPIRSTRAGDNSDLMRRQAANCQARACNNDDSHDGAGDDDNRSAMTDDRVRQIKERLVMDRATWAVLDTFVRQYRQRRFGI